MAAAAVLAALLVAFVLLRLWDDARDVAREEPLAPDAGRPPDLPPAPASPGVRVAAIAVSLVLGVVSYVALPALLDGILGDDDRPQETWTLCRRPPADVRGPDGSASLWLSDHGCG